MQVRAEADAHPTNNLKTAKQTINKTTIDKTGGVTFQVKAAQPSSCRSSKPPT
jgi:hypothetical protein